MSEGEEKAADAARKGKESAKKILDGMKKANKNMGKGGGPAGALLKLAIGTAGLGWLGFNSLFTVDGGHRAVMFNRISGVQDEVKGEGMHVMVPWFDMPVIYDVRTRPRNIQSLTGSKDLQMVNITLRVLSKPNENELPFIYKRLGQDFDERVLPSIVNEVLKQVVARYNASELLTKREMVSQQIRQALTARARDFQILLDDVAITHLSFSREYTAAVERKQVAQQDAERAKYVVDKARQEQQSIMVRAEGEAEAAEKVGAAIKDNPGFVQLRRIDAARDISATISKSANKVYLTADSLLLNLMGDGSSESAVSSSRR